MASDSSSSRSLITTNTNHTTLARRRIPFRRRRRLPIVHLGGVRPRPSRGLSVVRIFRRARLKWLKLKNYSIMFNKLKDYYQNLMKDIIEGGGTVESFQQRMLMESSFAIPVMGMSFH